MAGCRGAVYNVQIKVAGMTEFTAGQPLRIEAANILAQASAARNTTEALLQKAIGL